MKNFFQLTVFIFGAFLFPLSIVSAAEAQLFATSTGPAGVGQEVAVELFLNTGGNSVNALSAEINISLVNDVRAQSSVTDVQISRIYDGDSIISAWLTKATTDDAARISFSGIIPGGISTARGKVMTIYLIPERSGTLSFMLSGTIFENTLLGAPQPLSRSTVSIPVQVLPESAVIFLEQIDTTPPQIITAVIYQNEGMFDGRPFIIIHAKDAESGIATFELLETGGWTPIEQLNDARDLTWRLIDNPDQLLLPMNSGYIYVRVTDREGNSSVAEVSRPTQLSPETGKTLFNKWLISFILTIVAGLFLWLWSRKRKRHALQSGSFDI